MGKDILSKAQLEANLTELDSVLQKSQIVQGGNSSRQSWAGSEFEKVSPPNNTPNGTDYVPPKTIAHKAISEMSDAEIEHYMEMRKAGVANPIAAEQEILSTVADVAKAQCPVCEGTQISKSNFNEPCEHCNGFGYVWLCKSEQAQEQIEEIEKKWNVDKIGKGGGPQAKNKGGGRGAADTTPPSGRPYRKEALDDTGEDVAGEDTDIENPGVSKSVRDTMREMSYMDTALNKATDDEDMELEEEDEEDEEDVEKCAKKALETEMIFRSFQTLNRSQGTLLQEVTSLRKSVAILLLFFHCKFFRFVFKNKILFKLRECLFSSFRIICFIVFPNFNLFKKVAFFKFIFKPKFFYLAIILNKSFIFKLTF